MEKINLWTRLEQDALDYDGIAEDSRDTAHYARGQADGIRETMAKVGDWPEDAQAQEEGAVADSAEDIAKVAEMTAAFLHEDEVGLSFEELAEDLYLGLQELLRRSQANPESTIRKQEYAFENALSVLKMAMTPEPTPDAYPHLDIDGEPGVTGGGAP